MRTIRREPYAIRSGDNQGLKSYGQYEFHGIKLTNNMTRSDVMSMNAADNVFIDDKKRLSSRPPLVYTTVAFSLTGLNIIDYFEFGKLRCYVLLDVATGNYFLRIVDGANIYDSVSAPTYHYSKCIDCIIWWNSVEAQIFYIATPGFQTFNNSLYIPNRIEADNLFNTAQEKIYERIVTPEDAYSVEAGIYDVKTRRGETYTIPSLHSYDLLPANATYRIFDKIQAALPPDSMVCCTDNVVVIYTPTRIRCSVDSGQSFVSLNFEFKDIVACGIFDNESGIVVIDRSGVYCYQFVSSSWTKKIPRNIGAFRFMYLQRLLSFKIAMPDSTRGIIRIATSGQFVSIYVDGDDIDVIGTSISGTIISSDLLVNDCLEESTLNMRAIHAEMIGTYAQDTRFVMNDDDLIQALCIRLNSGQWRIEVVNSSRLSDSHVLCCDINDASTGKRGTPQEGTGFTINAQGVILKSLKIKDVTGTEILYSVEYYEYDGNFWTGKELTFGFFLYTITSADITAGKFTGAVDGDTCCLYNSFAIVPTQILALPVAYEPCAPLWIDDYVIMLGGLVTSDNVAFRYYPLPDVFYQQRDPSKPTIRVRSYLGRSSIYFQLNNGELWRMTNDLVTLTKHVMTDLTPITTVPTISQAWGDNLILVYDSMLRVTKNIRNGGDIAWNLPALNDHSFSSSVNSILLLSESEYALFFDDRLLIMRKVEDSTFGYRYEYVESKMDIGVRKGDKTINTVDGRFSVIPMRRGLGVVNYQEFIAVPERGLTFVTDDILKIWTDFYNASARIDLSIRDSYLYISNGTRHYLLYDFRGDAWFTGTVPFDIARMATVTSDVCLICNNQLARFDYGFTGPKYLDFQEYGINWEASGTPINLGTVDSYKNLRSTFIQFEDSAGTLVDNVSVLYELASYRDINKTHARSFIDFAQHKGKDLCAVRIPVRHWKIKAVAWTLKNDKLNVTQHPMRLSFIGFEYEIGDEI